MSTTAETIRNGVDTGQLYETLDALKPDPTLARREDRSTMLSTKQAAPPINAVSLSGRPIDLDEFRGKKVLVKFHRFSGCPVARRQVHDLIEGQEALNAAGIETITVLHSSEEKMRPNFDDVPGLHLIADPKKALYRAYGVQFRWRRLLSPGTWRETLVSFGRGYLPQLSRFEGGIVGVPCDFLLDEKGTITAVHYGTHFGDSWTAADALRAAAAE
jgi:peroxiredoxin